MHQFYLGIDASKGYADFALLNQQKQVVKSAIQLDDTHEGHHKLYNYLSEFYSEHPEAKIYAAVESTGGFENNWFSLLRRLNFQDRLLVARINPFGVKMHGKAALKRMKTDRISAENIAEYLMAHPDKIQYYHEDSFASLRRYWSTIKLLSKQKTQLINQLHALIYIAHTELVSYCRAGIPIWVLHLLYKYPTAELLAASSLDEVQQIPFIKTEHARRVLQHAQSSVASVGDLVIAQDIRILVSEIFAKNQRLAECKKTLEQLCDIPEVRLLTSFPGIGVFSAIGLVIEIGSVSRFSSVKQLASYFGVHPVHSQSGDLRSKDHMSKKGRVVPRAILFTVAMAAIRTNPLIKSIYAQHKQKGMASLAAIGALMHKILRIVYGMLKNNTPFDPEIDKRNSTKKEKYKPAIKIKKPLLLPVNQEAPISGKQFRLRKEQELTQKEESLSAGSDPCSNRLSLSEN